MVLDVPADLVINLDQTPISYVSPVKYTFNFKGSKNVPRKGVDDFGQITATFAIHATGEFLPMQLIYPGKTKRCLPNFQFPRTFQITYTENHWSNQTKAIKYFEKVIFLYLEKIKVWKCYPKEQMLLVIMNTFKGQDKDEMRKFWAKNSCEIVIITHNLTNKFQPLDTIVNKAAKFFISDKYNSWFANDVSNQLRAEKGSCGC